MSVSPGHPRPVWHGHGRSRRNLGDEQIVAVRVGDRLVESVIDTSVSAKVGDQVWLLVQPERVHIFDLGTDGGLAA